MNTLVSNNTQLLKLIAEAHLDDRDTQEILRIFPILWEKRQLEILDDWPRVSDQIRLHREQIEKEKEIFLIQAIENIEKDLEDYNKKLIQNTSKDKLQRLVIQK